MSKISAVCAKNFTWEEGLKEPNLIFELEETGMSSRLFQNLMCNSIFRIMSQGTRNGKSFIKLHFSDELS